MSLPPFLQPRLPANPLVSDYLNGIFHHKYPLGPSHAQWWPAKLGQPETVILFIPGNPGLLDFYTPFLTAIHDQDTTSKLAILSHSHIGHTPGVVSGPPTRSPEAQHGLSVQIEGSLETFDAICSAFGPNTKVVIVGHSVGAWLSLQVLKERPLAVSAVFLLFPTISHIGNTPNGRRISWLFSPRMRLVISWLSYVTRVFPATFLSLVYNGWPLSQILVLQTLLHSPPSIRAALHMAHDEMETIRDLDVPLLDAHRQKLSFYFAEQDDWVGEQKDEILHSLKPASGAVRIVHGHPDIPHAFCINHGQLLAQQCHQWLSDSLKEFTEQDTSNS